MKRTFFLVFCAVFVLIATNTFAEEKATVGKIGKGNLAVKIDYINFTDDFFSDYDDAGIYVAVEGYWAITDIFYLGGEVGIAENITFFGDDLDYLPVELNAKYVIELSPHFYLDFGGGASYTRAKIEIENYWTEDEDLGEDWLLGGQVFMDLTYKINWFTVGLNGKYQITEEYKDTDVNFTNCRWGLSIGFAF